MSSPEHPGTLTGGGLDRPAKRMDKWPGKGAPKIQSEEEKVNIIKEELNTLTGELNTLRQFHAEKGEIEEQYSKLLSVEADAIKYGIKNYPGMLQRCLKKIDKE